jgi:hypothetical protein
MLEGSKAAMNLLDSHLLVLHLHSLNYELVKIVMSFLFYLFIFNRWFVKLMWQRRKWSQLKAYAPQLTPK